MKKILVLLTFDYELPLGQSSDYDKELFEPTAKLTELADQLQVPIVLFADVCSAIAFNNWNHKTFSGNFERQIQGAISRGHDVQLHIHPHWFTSEFVDGKFVPSHDFSLSNFTKPKHGYDLESIIEVSYSELSKMCKVVAPDYKCVAFRAGGYDIEPESARIMTKLSDLGIKIDTSVIKEFFVNYGFTKVDYRHAPHSSFWKVSTRGPLITAANEGLLEFPIASKPVGVKDVVMRRIKKVLNKKALARRAQQNGGKGLIAVQGKESFDVFVRKLFNPTVLSFDKEHLECYDLMEIVRYLDKQHESESGTLVVTAIGHPKSMGTYHLDLFKDFITQLRKTFGDRIGFTTYPELLKSGEFTPPEVVTR